MRQFIPEQAVDIRAYNSTENRYNDDEKTTAHQGVKRTGTSTCDGPTQTKYLTTDQVPLYTQFLWC